MSIFYSATTGGFYDSDIHGSAIPADAVEITDEEHAALLAAQASGQLIEPDADGCPCACNPPAPSPEQQAGDARVERDRRLRDCDWTALSDVPLDTTARDAWSTYRQALRDVPSQAGFPTTIAWPTAPGASA